ncbi:DUF6194 family protein [Chamaesiphon minutus]|uniref:DUF6194 domain-containing protein n=1 Tax=Chamaesiphon minutus (strain ATCC 27169 / PCC 6605) TaxID=1173020 RepID=K9UPD9_CHAP6|nr:DUF6194 family protein [Chamaesiphon minutus]AFY96957.1 hypothetical protein Cha6605_6122 [Chamaesiphon minutus PCC 6605]
MTPEEIIQYICNRLSGVVPKASWGETSLFYNPGYMLPNGVYFCTIKQHNGENDKASNLDREDVFRVAIGLTPKTYVRLFGRRPTRPGKGGIVATEHDFTELNELMPHPIYAWISWVQILSPSRDKFEEVFPLIEEAHQEAVKKFVKKTANNRVAAEQ